MSSDAHTCTGPIDPESSIDNVQILIESVFVRPESSNHAEQLRSHGLQVTAQRLAVLRTIEQRPHASATDIADAVRAELGTISRQAVYDSLGVLVDRGIVRCIQPAGSPARYEDRVGDNHHHLICRRCDRVVDVDCAVDHTPCLIPSDDSDFAVDEAEVVYWGVCPDCQKNT